jgi:hypothetical protein
VEPRDRVGKGLRGTIMTMTTDTTMASGLPVEFAALEPFSAWIIEKQDDRYERRLASSMEEMQALYDTMMPLLPAIIEYCNRFSLDDLPDSVHKLMLLSYSLVQASFPVEAWKQARVPDSGAAYIACIREPLV